MDATAHYPSSPYLSDVDASESSQPAISSQETLLTKRCYAANREQPQIENSNEMHDIHCAIMVFMAQGHIALAGAMNREYAS